MHQITHVRVRHTLALQLNAVRKSASGPFYAQEAGLPRKAPRGSKQQMHRVLNTLTKI